jgi:hypothetical protein
VRSASTATYGFCQFIEKHVTPSAAVRPEPRGLHIRA